MKKILAILLLIIMLLSLCGCGNVLYDIWGNLKVGPGRRPPNSELNAFLYLESYDELLETVNLGKEKGFDYDFCYYTFSDLSEEYQPIYSFTYHNVWTVYPITKEDFINMVHSMPSLTTDVYCIGEGQCELHDGEMLYRYYDRPSDELKEYSRYPAVKIARIYSEFVDIEDSRLLSATLQRAPREGSDFYEDKYYEYYCYYDGAHIFNLLTCFELSDDELSYFLNHVVSIR